MTARLEHTPAKPSSPPTLRLKNVDKLLADKSFAFNPFAEAEDRVRAAIDTSAREATGEADRLGSGGATVRSGGATVRSGGATVRSGGATVRSGGATVRSGGATVPHCGIVAPPLPSQDIPKPALSGSSTVKRWSFLSRIQRLCRPSEEGARGPAVVGCGMPGHGVTDVGIHLRTSEQTGEIRAGVSGVYRCGSPWLCPVCAVGKAHDRAQRVQAAAEATLKREGRAALVVLTASHSRDMSLAEIKTLVSGASSAARKGRAWTAAVHSYGILGVIVGQEVTYSLENGWHYHQHLSVLVDGPGGDAYQRAQAAGEWIANAYAKQVRNRGGTVSDRHGWHVRIAVDSHDASNYTAKGSMAWEVAGGHKDATRSESSLTPWDIAVAAADGDGFMFGRWREYMETMPGTRSCVVSPSLAEALGISAAVEESNGGDQLLESSDVLVGHVKARVWTTWMRHGLAATFLSRVEKFRFNGCDEQEFEAAVDATNLEAAPFEAEYERRRQERSYAQRRELQRRADAVQMTKTERETEFAKAYAINRLQRFADSHGSRARIAAVIEDTVAAFPAARRLLAEELYHAAA